MDLVIQSLNLLKIFFLLCSVFLVNMSTFILFIKAVRCSSVCKNCLTDVLVIKQEIAERERGLEKACGAKMNILYFQSFAFQNI